MEQKIENKSCKPIIDLSIYLKQIGIKTDVLTFTQLKIIELSIKKTVVQLNNENFKNKKSLLL